MAGICHTTILSSFSVILFVLGAIYTYHDGRNVAFFAASLPLTHSELLEHVHERMLADW